jgi:hypothetical protein
VTSTFIILVLWLNGAPARVLSVHPDFHTCTEAAETQRKIDFAVNVSCGFGEARDLEGAQQ